MVVFISTALPGILLYIIGFPASLYIVLRRLQLKSALKHGDKNYDKRWALRLGFLYAGYEEGFVYWESLVLLRKASLSAAVVLLSHFGTDVQINVSLAILVLCLYLQMRYEPLEHDWHDTMEARSLLASTLILLASHLASEASGEEGIIEGANATWLSFIVFLITFAFMWTWARFVLIFLSKAEGQKRKKLSVKFANTLLTTCACCCRVREEDVSNAEFFTARARNSQALPMRLTSAPQDLEMVSLDGVAWTENKGIDRLKSLRKKQNEVGGEA